MIGYLETLAIIENSGSEGVAYASFTRAMKAHARSLYAEGIVAGFVGDDHASLDTEGVVICSTAQGSTYVEMLTELGLIVAPVKAKAKTARKSKTTRSVPTPIESVELSVPATAPKGSKVRRVAGGSQDQAQVVKITQEDRMQAQEGRMQALEAQLGQLIAIMSDLDWEVPA